MAQNHRHSKQHSDPADQADRLFSRADIVWEKSKTEIWKDLNVRLKEEDQSQNLIRRFLPGRQWIALAASLVLLLAVTGFLRFYSIRTHCPGGTQTSLDLPDGSVLEINAESTIKYHPYWWFISRSIYLEGEAFFRVENGRPFKVVSRQAITEVLGTTFNIYSRDQDYRVSCHSGNVRVNASSSGKFVTLHPGEQVELERSGDLTVTRLKLPSAEPGWMNRLITFTTAPLRMVFNEIERQYGIVIETPSGMQEVYSGKFSLDLPVEQILSLLCLPFDLEYEHKTGKTYRIYPVSRE